MRMESNTAKEVLDAKKNHQKTEQRKRKESTERLIQNYFSCKDAKEKQRLLSIIRVNNPDFSGK